MASLQKKGESWYCQFLYLGKRHTFTLGKVAEDEAHSKADQVGYLLMRLRQKLISVPSGIDIATFLRHDGHLPDTHGSAVATTNPSFQAATISSLINRYLETHSNGTLEESTLGCLRSHFKHLVTTLGEKFLISDLTLADLQRHVERRTKGKGIGGRKLSPVTIKKEIVSLRTAWNWGELMGLVSGKFPNKGLRYPKLDEKPAFQTYAEIETQVSRGSLSVAEVNDLWNCLFLTQSELNGLLEYIQRHATQPWVWPAACLAAHTGVRRSEVLRIKLADLDLVSETVVIHEKKRSRGKRTTRRVPVSPFLKGVLEDWLSTHPGGQFLFCQAIKVARSKTKRTAPTPVTRDEAHHHLEQTLTGSKWHVLRGWHVLRHSFISCCAAKGVDQRMIDEWVGHTTEEMRRRYRHLAPSTEKQAIRSVFA